MLRNVLAGLALLIVAVFAFVGYNSYSVRQQSASSEVYGVGPVAVTGVVPNRPAGSSPVPATAPTGSAASPRGAGDGNQEITAGGAHTANGTAPPAADSIAPDPPNGMTFGGNGHYQLYRQGDLTWRLNTDTGETCVLFATDEEWRKPKVYRAGCRGRQ